MLNYRFLQSPKSPPEAYRSFADGVARPLFLIALLYKSFSRMGINWQQMTGMSRPRELFKIFDLEPPQSSSSRLF